MNHKRKATVLKNLTKTIIGLGKVTGQKRQFLIVRVIILNIRVQAGTALIREVILINHRRTLYTGSDKDKLGISTITP